ncbi:hypothetical protein JVX90_00135 [Gordonia sp. PDNC005]|uniref:hypothetical protein n=1 Tax=Gordonia sp. PDNC005 TaxID=2811424 RepID=UPI0019639442|nr:hypothetical protein [Gordonia sp. PDNC005]QRY64830.1 hypothetical protein JVX90_00135 [Gordonia sp. PDNC005]
MTIDPTTCKPGDAYRVRTGSGDEYVGERVDPEDYLQWRLNRPASVWVRDVDVTVLHRLVPAPEEETLDVPMQPWELVRAARQVLIDHDRYTDGDWMTERLEAEAAHLEREHRAAQEKAEQDADKRTIGLTGKYRVERIDGKPVDWAFVLQDTDPFTPVALLAYAGACEGSYPALARDLRQKAADLQNAAEQDAAREALIDKAARVMHANADLVHDDWDTLSASARQTWRNAARRLADAGYLAEAGEGRG